jgi:hypothetical protein
MSNGKMALVERIWSTPREDEANYPRRQGRISGSGAGRKIERAEIPFVNFELAEVGANDLLGKNAADWQLDFGFVLKNYVYGMRGKGLAYEKLPGFFKKIGVGLDEPAMGGSTLASMACRLDCPELLKLVAEQVDLDQKDSSGRGLVEVCSSHGASKCMAILMKIGLDVDAPFGPRGTTPLMEACDATEPCESLVALLANKARCSAVDNMGMSALSFACKRGFLSLDAIDLLCAFSDVDLVDKEGMTPLLWAIDKGQAKPYRVRPPMFDREAVQYYFQAVAAHSDFTKHASWRQWPEKVCEQWFARVPGGAGIGEWLRSKRESAELSLIGEAGVSARKSLRV